jgi:hypothetical protein
VKKIISITAMFITFVTIFLSKESGIIEANEILKNIILLAVFVITLICLYWSVFSYIIRINYARLALIVFYILYIHNISDSKDKIVIGYITLAFLVFGLIHALIKMLFLKKKRQSTNIIRNIYIELSNYNILISITLIAQFIQDYVFIKLYKNFYIDFFEILVIIVVYNLLINICPCNCD